MTADLIAEARAHVAAMADAAPPNSRARIMAGDVVDERTSLLVRLTNALEAADAAFQQLHFACDNPDHLEAYQALAKALDYYHPRGETA